MISLVMFFEGFIGGLSKMTNETSDDFIVIEMSSYMKII